MADKLEDTTMLLLKAVEEKDAKGFSDLAAKSKQKSEKNSMLGDLLKLLSDQELVDFWTNLFEMVRKSTPVLLEIEDPENPNEKLPPNAAADVMQSSMVLANLMIDMATEVPVGLYQMIVLLHGVFLRFWDSKDNVKNSISQLCETFYVRKLPGNEELILNSSIYLLTRTLRLKGIKKDLKRVWLMKDAIGCLIKHEEHNQEIISILKKCMSSSLYLSSLEGQKFMAFFLSFDVSVVEPFHDAIKGFLPSCSLKQAASYGTVYYNAWMNAVKHNSSEIKEKLELNCIQDLMYYAIHVQRNIPRSLVPLLRKLLSVFHNNKKEHNVLRMLRDLYQPILWRALKSSNANVRTNATQLFFDVFPLEDPDFNKPETDAELTRQLILIKDLLVDECILVRCISAIGVCVVMACNWEIIEPEMIKTYFKVLIEELSCDSSSADVRCSVVKGLEALLNGNQLAIPTLKIFLPKFKDLFHDMAEKVRVAFCRLLLAVKKIRFIKFWDIVPLEDLLARMSEDKPAVAKLVVQLLCNSFFPAQEKLNESRQKDKRTEELEHSFLRCIELIKTDRLSSRVFFKHAPDYASTEALANFVTFTIRMLHKYVQSKNAKSKKSLPLLEDKENQNISLNSSTASTKCDVPLAFDDPEVIGGTVDSLIILWIAIQKQIQKPENKTIFKSLIANFKQRLPPLLKYFKNSEIRTSIFMLCSFMPNLVIPDFDQICLSQLQSLPVDAPGNEISLILACLCNQNQNDKLLELIQNWVHCGLTKEVLVQKKKRNSKQPAEVEILPKPFLAAKLLVRSLEQPMCRKKILQMNIPKLKEIVGSNASVQDVIVSSRKQLDSEQEEEFLFRIFSSITKISVLLHSKGDMDCDKFIQSQMSWVSDVFLSPNDEEGTSRKSRGRKRSVYEGGTSCWRNLGLKISEDLLKILIDMVMTGYIKNSVEEYIKFSEAVLKSEYGPALLKDVSYFVRQLCDSLIFLLDDTSLQKNNLSLVQKSFISVISSCKNEQFFAKVDQADIAEIKFSLRDILLMQLKYNFATKDDVALLIKAILDGLYSAEEDLLFDEDDDDASTCFTPLSITLLSVLNANISLTKLSISIITEWCKENLARCYLACLLVLYFIQESKNIVSSAKNEVTKFIAMLEKELSRDVAEASEQERNIQTRIDKHLRTLKEPFEDKSDAPER